MVVGGVSVLKIPMIAFQRAGSSPARKDGDLLVMFLLMPIP